jgi:3-methyl-2-oxobutanoate hydroxymethyltransferase
VGAYVGEVKRRAFPDDAHSFHSSTVRLVPDAAGQDEDDSEPSGGVMGAPV